MVDFLQPSLESIRPPKYAIFPKRLILSEASDFSVLEPNETLTSSKTTARLIAETGPLSDFSSFRQLLRYAGLNLCERKSGVWRGKTKISRRGRANLRHVLNLWALSLVSPGRLYATYYRRKRDTEKMPGTKAMVCVMRKSLKMLYGWSRSGEAFDQGRVQSNRSATRTTLTLAANCTAPTTQQQVAS